MLRLQDSLTLVIPLVHVIEGRDATTRVDRPCHRSKSFASGITLDEAEYEVLIYLICINMSLGSTVITQLERFSKVPVYIGRRETTGGDSVLISPVKMDELIAMYERAYAQPAKPV